MKYFYFLLFPLMFFGQNEDSTVSVIEYSILPEFGTVLKTNFYLQNVGTPMNYQGATFMISKKTNGEKLWQRAFNNPSYSIGISLHDFKANRDFGNPVIVFGNFTGTAKNWNKLRWEYWINFGISFNSSPFDFDNYPNISLSTSKNLYVGAGTRLKYQIGKQFNVGLGFAYNHLSNGSTNSPNKGLNFVAPQLSLSYTEDRPKESIIKGEEVSSYELNNTLELSGYYAKKFASFQAETREVIQNSYAGFPYNIYGIEALYTKQYSIKSSWGLGLGLIYDEEYNHTMFLDNSALFQKKRFKNDRLLLSILPTYRLNIDRLKVDLSLGYYPFKNISNYYDRYRFFQRLGLRYRIGDRLLVSFGINAHDFHKANYLEWKVGYVLFNKQRSY